ncbi:MAG: ABC transporter permease subunit, partial [Calditrichaeota bacterium]
MKVENEIKVKQPSLDRDKYYQQLYRKDHLAARLISMAGYAVIVSILAIFLFLLYQSLPLGKDASISELLTIPAPNTDATHLLTGSDDYLELFFALDVHGHLKFYKISDGELVKEETLPLDSSEKILAVSQGNIHKHLYSIGTSNGKVVTFEIKFLYDYSGTKRVISPELSIEDIWELSSNDTIPNHTELLAYTENEDGVKYWAWVNHQQQLHLRVYNPDYDETTEFDLTDEVGDATFTEVAMSHDGYHLLAATQSSEIFWFDISDPEEVSFKNSWIVKRNVPVTSLEFLLGNQTAVVGLADGGVESWFPVRTTGNNFEFRKIHTFDSHPAAITSITPSPRNRNFLTTDANGGIRLHYSTTGRTEIKFKPADAPVSAAAFAPKSNGIIILNNHHQFSVFRLDNPHPETTPKSLFGKVWYEGYPGPEFVWQSTGGSDEFEPKLSLVPLIFGTLKGTFYAMLFSVPIALLGAIYVSQFAPKRLVRVIKPTIEIMAAIPSVVIGFLAGLYFSTVFEEHLMTLFAFLILLPVVFWIGLKAWNFLPEQRRLNRPAGIEIVFALIIFIMTYMIAKFTGKYFELHLFKGNFQQWLYSNLNVVYETRNSFVVGFALGFAVIPIIFTVAEDALSNVPDALTSASLALGASRWQTVRRVVIPAAAGGIFAAVMLGLGRAVGET